MLKNEQDSDQRIQQLEHLARQVRASCIKMAHDGREGHLTSALSCTDILVALYGGWLKFNPARPDDPKRDRLLFSKGHAASALYATLAAHGYFPTDKLVEYAKSGKALPNHPCKLMLPCLEMSSGSLGHGLGIGTGLAYSHKLRGNTARTVVVMSDGECNEGSVYEAASFACARKLDNLIAIIDNNDMQAVGRTSKLLGDTSFEAKFSAFGWAARTIDGHDISQLLATLDALPFAEGRPSAIICKTTGGRGISFMEDQTLWHYRAPSADDLERALEELGVRPLHGEPA
jgi:transketolase